MDDTQIQSDINQEENRNDLMISPNAHNIMSVQNTALVETNTAPRQNSTRGRKKGLFAIDKMKDFTEAELQRFPAISQQNLSKEQVRSNPVLYKALSLFRRSQNSKEYISRCKLASDAEKEMLKSELEKKSKELMAEKGKHQAELEKLTILKEDSLKVDILLGGPRQQSLKLIWHTINREAKVTNQQLKNQEYHEPVLFQ